MSQRDTGGAPDFPASAFERIDESDDSRFYETDRFVSHLDRTALDTVERIVGTLIVEESPAVLDLMAGWDSHLPQELRPGRVTGLGLNRNELERNPALDEFVLHDLNAEPRLPFPDATFDVVLNTVSVDYMTRPVELFREVARILEPGGLFLVVFSNRMFPDKAVRIWRESSEEERVALVDEFFIRSGAFDETRLFVSRGLPRPEDDKYAGTGLPSDPIYAVYAERPGRDPGRAERPEIAAAGVPDYSPEEVEERKKWVRRTMRCPYCDVPLTRQKLPDTPFNEWDVEFVYLCFNPDCPYTTRSWDVMRRQGNVGYCYRLMYLRERDCFYCCPDIGRGNTG
jgi:SAM-dependent methyltransferase